MNISIICIGKLKEKYWRDASDEYEKRLARYCRLDVRELKEASLPAKASAADEEKVREKEGKAVLAAIWEGSYVITLEIDGQALSSEEFAVHIDKLGVRGKSSIVFVIGGSLGLSEDVSRRADMKLSFSKMTFTHQMMRPVLLEQIYRGFKISSSETYHK